MTCLADRTFTGHVLKAVGSWPGIFHSSCSSSVLRNEGAFSVEGVQGWLAEEQAELASVQ